MLRQFLSSRGFTLVEMILVIAIIMILFLVSTIPYGYYMNRARVEQSTESIAQKWTLVHTDVRSGVLFDSTKNANMFLVFESGSSRIDIYLLSGSTIPSFPITESTDIKKYDTVLFPKNIAIRSLSGVTLDAGNRIGYMIQAPYGRGQFTDTSTGLLLTIGYPEGNLANRLVREIYLTPQNY